MAGIRSGSTPPRDHDVATFDRRAGSYERDWRSEFHTRVVATAAEVALAALPDPTSLLDVGCGTGALLRTLADRLPAGVALSGVDPAPAMLEVGRAALGQRSRVWLARAVAERLPFRDASFDLVVTTVSFDHWTDQPAGLTEAARVLRPAGRLVLIDLFAIGWLRPITALGRRRDRVHTIAELERLLTRARLTPLAWERIYDLGPLPLIRAVIAGHSVQLLAASG
jgi:ubiquinone/menaquinone biosynthesis C-methylase UbiE